ncbi:MAG: tRNA (guanosine(46)-N7)-methyltransferase TrmB [Cyanothece sp. SIO2G6]|nr:tRNA (guanosine(46)-N7)-methyltransferase TrmB [Cyanothece sp. SIO2G6]
MVTVRVRQHVNPLAIQYREPSALPDWSDIYADLAQPFHLDIGSAHGHFLFGMAQQHPDWNFLGLEIRKPLVDFANAQQQVMGLGNLYFLFGNVTASLHTLLASLPDQSLQRVTIQFPDPWFKRRHHKRRVVQPELVDTLAQYLVPGGWLFVQSDIEGVAVEMRDRIHAHTAFSDQGEGLWYPENPFAVLTEREAMTAEKGEPVYRALFKSNLHASQ